MIIAGIDEAGRGPAIGPLVIAIASIDEKNLVMLQAMGVKDSKLLSPAARERIYKELLDVVKYEIVPLSPKEVDHAVESESTNLNWLEADTAAKLLNKMQPPKAYIDCPSATPRSYTEYIQAKLDYDPQLIVEHKADTNYLIVGAASILAKVTRDRMIEEIKKKYNVEFGSGYPADPMTIKFTEEHWNEYDFFRKSWASWKNAANRHMQKTLKGF